MVSAYVNGWLPSSPDCQETLGHQRAGLGVSEMVEGAGRSVKECEIAGWRGWERFG
jgi:hypothetical protein